MARTSEILQWVTHSTQHAEATAPDGVIYSLRFDPTAALDVIGSGWIALRGPVRLTDSLVGYDEARDLAESDAAELYEGWADRRIVIAADPPATFCTYAAAPPHGPAEISGEVEGWIRRGGSRLPDDFHDNDHDGLA